MKKTLHEILLAPRSTYFWVERENGKFISGHPQSRYASGADPQEASFDIGNNKVIICVAPNGGIRYLTFFDENEYADSIPGVWVHKRSRVFKNLSFSLVHNNKEQRLADYQGKVRTFLIENVIPATEFFLPGMAITVIHFAPIAGNGSIRPRAAYSIVYVRNTSDVYFEGALKIPAAAHFSEAGNDSLPPDIRMENGDRKEHVPVRLSPGAEDDFTFYTTVYGEKEQKELSAGALYWLNETLDYYRNLTGELVVSGDEFLAEFFQRSAHQCQQCIGMDSRGFIAGSSWGTNPTTLQIWMKDMYYSLLPLSGMDPDLFAKSMEWFSKWGIRPAGRRFPGGVKHSLSNSLSGVLMAGQYYHATGDIEYFSKRPELVETLIGIIDEMLDTRPDPDIWLFPSVWISDGLSMGNYHTGSNITVFAAIMGFADILEKLDQRQKASDYRAVAEKVKRELLERCVTDKGPFGPQLLEGWGDGEPELREKMKASSPEEFLEKNKGFGVQFYEFFNRKDQGPYLVHDGEETDTTLSPFYGLLKYDDVIYKNYTHFAMTEHNKFYRPLSRGILWEKCTDSTFPGYVTGAANVVDKETYDGNPGYFAVIRTLTDLDGSIWWWPYSFGAQDHSNMKRMPGKCGWASGALLTLIIHDWFGIVYKAPEKTLWFSPLDFLHFNWKNAPFGAGRFDISHGQSEYAVRNRNAFSVTLVLRFFGNSLLKDGKPIDAEPGIYLGRKTVQTRFLLLPGEAVKLEVR
jgi:hypothetical protein